MSLPVDESTTRNALCPNMEYSSFPGVHVKRLICVLQLSVVCADIFIASTVMQMQSRILFKETYLGDAKMVVSDTPVYNFHKNKFLWKQFMHPSHSLKVKPWKSTKF